MRVYMVEDITLQEREGVIRELEAMELGAGLEGIYWLPVPREMLSLVQAEHTQSCGPHVMALEVEDDALRLELLVRARNRLRCECVHYASTVLCAHMMNYVDALLERQTRPA